MTQVQKFDPSTLMEGVRQRIKATFVSLIPDDQWEQLCKKEVDNFFIPKDRYTRNREDCPSEFSDVCKKVLSEISKEKIKEYLADYDSTVWSQDGLQCSEALSSLIIKLAPEVFAATFGNMFQNAVSQMKRY